MKHITSRDNPFFKELKKLATSARQRRKQARTLLDGTHLLQACLALHNKPLHVLVNAAALRDGEVSALLEETSGTPLTLLDDSLFAELTELKTATGILALIEPPPPRVSAARSRFCLLLEGIQDPGNLGSILRSAAAAGCDAAFLSAGCADAWSPRVLRAGMGGHFALDLHESANLVAAAADFNGKVYAAVPGGPNALYDCDLRGGIAFAIGNEGAGLSEALLRAAIPVSIPMPGRVESLNAAAAAAVCLFEAMRQRRHDRDRA